jgi:hypothetical protein
MAHRACESGLGKESPRDNCRRQAAIVVQISSRNMQIDGVGQSHVSVHGRGGDLDRQAVRRSGVGGGGHRTVGLRWSCKASTMAERGIR